ncbi:glycine cleavage system aminomethyltransferase GcvT [Oceanicella actignis]|uniref:aminomethyltransferase n=1 Tax=Oceanicella actignis TaxID=1189325 RepID=A0A1M7TMY4_9RHOB|nr:glycine cleavage system aminomethyltransferase GcvT [Oceanicella actignis]SET71784.1 aminomethyltransferase [Oceanicella actignis]SHN72046.1 aminomethyltransferase [Oceanicella actignis]
MTDETRTPGDEALLRTPLHDLHLALGGKMVAFAGYALPVQYPAGVLKEHLHTRAAASLFDVSHMGQIAIRAASGLWEDAALALETVTCADVLGLAPGRQRYGLFTNENGGILDDFMFAREGDALALVVNGACKAADLAHLRARLDGAASVRMIEDRALLALQGPMAEAALAALGAPVGTMRFMDARRMTILGADCFVTRSGYTGEDGFEISVPAEAARALAEALLDHEAVEPAGLGARDSLRLEAGLCLYGADIDETTTPVEADLAWSIQKTRRAGGARQGGFPGTEVILRQLIEGAPRRRVGLRPEGRAPVRAGAPLFADEDVAAPVGHVTSGGFSPTLQAPAAMGYVPAALAEPGRRLFAELRGRRVPALVAPLPLVPTSYKR